MSYNWAMERPSPAAIPTVVTAVHVERYPYRWFGMLEVQPEGAKAGVRLPLTGNIAQWFQPGEAVAIAGASGAGKTTLLGLLYGQAGHKRGVRYQLDDGELELPENTQAVIYLPGKRSRASGELPCWKRSIS